MRKTPAALIALVCACALAPQATAAAPQLQVSGNRLVDTATNTTFVPRGVNWPSFEYACFYGYGYSNTASATSVGPDAAGAALIASWHVNTVRVPLNQDCWLGDDGKPDTTQGMLGLTAAGYRQAVQDWVALLHAQGLAVILDLHWSGPNGVLAEGQRAMADDRSPAFWTSVATTFVNDRAVLFDAFNEPYSRYNGNTLVFDLTWSCWLNGGCAAPNSADSQPYVAGQTFTTVGMQALVTAIRGAGATQPILLGGRDYANDLGLWLTNRPADNQLVASFHNYNTQVCNTVACWDSVIAPIAAQVPVVTTEFGTTDCTENHVNSHMSWADQHGVGYLGWQWVILDTVPVCSDLVLIKDTSGTPQPPNGTALKSHLAALAAAAHGPGPGPGAGTGPGSGTGPGTGTGPGGTTPGSRGSAALRLNRPALKGRRLRLTGSVSPAAASKPLQVKVTYRRAGSRRSLRIKRSVKPASSGRFALTIRLPRRSRPRSVSVRFPGTATLAPKTVTRSLR